MPDGCVGRFAAQTASSQLHNLQTEEIPMDTITIEVWDATGNKKQLVEVPVDAPVNRVIAVLIERMNLPRHSPDGQLMSYKFHHKASGRQLLDDQTLAQGGSAQWRCPPAPAGNHRRVRWFEDGPGPITLLEVRRREPVGGP